MIQGLIRSISKISIAVFILLLAFTTVFASRSFAVDFSPGMDRCGGDFNAISTTYTAAPTDLAAIAAAEGLANGTVNCVNVDAGSLGFKIPTLGDILTFAIRVLFVVAGLAALFYLLLGAFAWVTSGGDKDAVTAAREKIQAAVIGMILIVGVLAIIWTLEQVVFNRRICLGLSCSLTLPGLIVPSGNDFCCVCINDTTGDRGSIINTSVAKCKDDGTYTAL